MAKYNLYIRAVPGYPRYYATVEGDILKKRGNSFFKLTPTKVHNGYYTVKIKHRVKVHRLVALAFLFVVVIRPNLIRFVSIDLKKLLLVICSPRFNSIKRFL